MDMRKAVIPVEELDRRIFLIRGHKVMLDSDLARLYGVETFNLNKAVHRNLARFPRDFSFVLRPGELANLKFQTGISSSHGGRRKPVRVFTEHGVAMLSSVLRSQRAISVNIAIMRAFARIRAMLATHKDLARRLEELESKCDSQFKAVFDAIRELLEPEDVPPKERIGFHRGSGNSSRRWTQARGGRKWRPAWTKGSGGGVRLAGPRPPC